MSVGKRCSEPGCTAKAELHRLALPYCPAHCGCRSCTRGIDASGRTPEERAARMGRGGPRQRTSGDPDGKTRRRR